AVLWRVPSPGLSCVVREAPSLPALPWWVQSKILILLKSYQPFDGDGVRVAYEARGPTIAGAA
ncbi:MAG: hypothetical protein JWN52_861, partial [Actinomycetia bacterium]|nr:hypothetical protein [Actinomycetes bacterium]